MSLEQKVTQAWYQDQAWVRALLPLSLIYKWSVKRRYRKSLKSSHRLSVPVVIVGNITVGGTGKTPLIIHLCGKLKDKGLAVGVISRGYGAKNNRYPYVVSHGDSCEEVGDEPLMICQQLDIPVVIDPDRYAAAKHLIETRKVDVILSDDGMQHYALPRELEILVVDGKRELGNQLLLPAGPLREPLGRIKEADFCLINGLLDELKSEALRYVARGSFSLQPKHWIEIGSGQVQSLEAAEFSGYIVAMAGIGNPQRFFDTVKSLRIKAVEHVLDDHQTLDEDGLRQLGVDDRDTCILMTTKDAVKYRSLLKEHGWHNCWALEVGVEMQEPVESELVQAIYALAKNKE